MKLGQRIIQVRDRTLIASLLTAGAKLDPGDEVSTVVGDRNEQSWNFVDGMVNGFGVRDLVAIYEREHNPHKNDWCHLSEEWCKAHSTQAHEFAVAWIAIWNRQWVQDVDKARMRNPSVMLLRGSSVAIIDASLDQKRADVFLQKIGA